MPAVVISFFTVSNQGVCSVGYLCIC